MAKPLKIFLIALSSLLLLLIAAVIALPLLFDPNDYRGKLAEAVKQQTGRDFSVGDIHLSVFPWLRVELSDLSLGNAEGFGSEPMLTAKRAELGVKLMPLLRERRVEASAIKLNGVQLALEVNEAGLSNWQDLLKPEEPDAAQPETPLAEQLNALDIQGVEFTDVTLRYQDRQKGQQLALEALALKTGRLHAGQPVPIEGSFRAMLSQQQLNADIAFSAEAAFDATTGDVAISQPKLRLKGEQGGASGQRLDAEIEGSSVNYAAGSQQLQARGLVMMLNGASSGPADQPTLTAKGKLATELAMDVGKGAVQLSEVTLTMEAKQAGAQPLLASFGLQTQTLNYALAEQTLGMTPVKVNVEQLTIGPADKAMLMAKGTVTAQPTVNLGAGHYALKGLDAALQLAGSALPAGKPQAVRLKAEVTAELEADQATVTALNVSALGLNATARQWRVAGLASDQPRLTGDLSVAEFALKPLLTSLGIALPPMADAKAMQTASLSSKFAASAKSISLSDLSAKLDDTTLRGEFAVRDLSTQAIRFALTADRLDVDRYLAPPAKATPASQGKPAAATEAFNSTELPIDMLDKLNAEGSLSVASMKLKNLKLANVRLKLDGHPGSTHKQQLSAALYGGTADLALAVAPGARESLQLKLSAVNAGPLLKDFMASDKLSGKGSFTLDVNTSGKTIGALRKALNGTLSFHLQDGAVKGFNLGKIMRDGQALLTATAAPANATQSTDFAEFRGSGTITNGVLKSSDLTAKNPLIRLSGAGEVDLVKETINYLAKPTLVNTAGGQGGKEGAELRGIEVPVRISGNLYQPKVAIDWKSAIQQQAVTQLREKLGVSEEVVREKREELRSKAKEELSKGLLKLFGGSKPAAPAVEPPATEAPANEPSPPPP
jgi:AsmA protein